MVGFVFELPCFSHFVCVCLCPPFCPTKQTIYIARVLIFRVAPKDKEIFLFIFIFFIFKSFPFILFLFRTFPFIFFLFQTFSFIFFLFRFFFSFLSFQIFFFPIVKRKQIDQPYLVLFKIGLGLLNQSYNFFGSLLIVFSSLIFQWG